jgi:hypothetical protein
VIKSLGNWKISGVIFLYALVLMVSALLLHKIGLWRIDDASTLILWAVVSGLPIVFSATDVGRRPGLFKKTLLQTVEWSAFLAFFLEMYSFHLWLEILLQPALLVFWAIGYIELASGTDPRVRRFARTVFWLLVAVMALNSARGIVETGNGTSWKEIANAFAVPIFWTLVSIGFLWVLAVVILYEQVALNFRIGTRPFQMPRRKARMAVLSVLRINLEDIAGFNIGWANRVKSQRTFHDARRVVKEYCEQRAKDRTEEFAAQQRLVEMAGIQGVDQHGRQLDQREFNETIDALNWLWTCHAGRYSRNNSYRQEVLKIVEIGGIRGLPDDHDIEMSIAPDGQSWYAWRQAVSGWYFAVGASGPPSLPGNKWYYDGTKPPTWPDEDDWNLVPGGNHSLNWVRQDF